MSAAKGPSATRATEMVPRRITWIVFLGLSIFFAFVGASDTVGGGSSFSGALFTDITGVTWEDLRASDANVATFIDYQVRAQGVVLLVFGILSAAVATTSLRGGKPWAWYAMWVYPILTGLVVLLLSMVPQQPGASAQGPMVSASVVLVISASALALSYRSFNAKELEVPQVPDD